MVPYADQITIKASAIKWRFQVKNEPFASPFASDGVFQDYISGELHS